MYSNPALVLVNPADPLYGNTLSAQMREDLAGQQQMIVGEGNTATFRVFTAGSGLEMHWEFTRALRFWGEASKGSNKVTVRGDDALYLDAVLGGTSAELPALLNGMRLSVAAGSPAVLDTVTIGTAHVMGSGTSRLYELVLNDGAVAGGSASNVKFEAMASSPVVIKTGTAYGGTATVDAARYRLSDPEVVSIRSASLLDEGTYTAVVKAADGASLVKSVPWTLTVNALPLITKNPVVTSKYPWDTATLSAGGFFSAETKFAWYVRHDGETVWTQLPAGPVPTTCVISNVQIADQGEYQMVATNSVGSAVSAGTYMTVERPAFLTLAAESAVAGTLELFPGDALNLSVGVTGALANSGNVTFQKLQPGNKWGNLSAPGGTQSRVYGVLSASEAEEGYYRVSATGVVNGVVYSNVVKVNVHDPIAFTATKVSSVVATEGEVFTLTAPVVGYAPTYQWKLNGVNIEVPGGTLSSYTSTASVLSAGTYSVLVRNYRANGDEFSSKTMEVAQVSVNAKPNVTMSGSVVRVDEGGTLSVVGSLSGTPGEVRYQWRKDGKPLLGAGVSGVAYVTAGGSVSVQYQKKTGVSALDEGHYDLVAANAFGVATGPLERVEVFAKPRFVETPGKANVEDVVALSGSEAVFRVNAEGSGTLKYQWYRSASATGGFVEYPNASGSDTSTLTVSGSALVDGSRYYVEVTSISVVTGTTLSSGSSSIATLRVSDKAGLLSVGGVRLNGGTEAASAALSLVGGNTLYATAKAVNPGSLKLSYQWRRNGENLAGGAGTVGAVVAGGSEFALAYALPARLDASSDGVYDVVVDNGAGVAVSPSMAVTLDPRIIAVDIPRMVNPGEAVKLSATVAGTLSSYAYKWIRDGEVVASDTRPGGLPFVIEYTGTLAAGSYQLRVGSSDKLYVETAPVKVSVAAAAAITTQPVVPTRVGASGTFTLSVVASGDRRLVRWREAPLRC